MIEPTQIAAAKRTKNSTGTRDPEMRQTREGRKWHHGLKCRIGTDAGEGLVRSVVGTSANVNDVTLAHKLLYDQKPDAFAATDYQGEAKQKETQGIKANWKMAIRAGKRRALDKEHSKGKAIDKVEIDKARIRTKIEQPYIVIKRQVGYIKVYRGLSSNTVQLSSTIALSSRWKARKRTLQVGLK